MCRQHRWWMKLGTTIKVLWVFHNLQAACHAQLTTLFCFFLFFTIHNAIVSAVCIKFLYIGCGHLTQTLCGSSGVGCRHKLPRLHWDAGNAAVIFWSTGCLHDFHLGLEAVPPLWPSGVPSWHYSKCPKIICLNEACVTWAASFADGESILSMGRCVFSFESYINLLALVFR